MIDRVRNAFIRISSDETPTRNEGSQLFWEVLSNEEAARDPLLPQ